MSDEEIKKNDEEEFKIPEGHQALFFQIGKDAFDSTWAFAQVDEDGSQIYTDIEWEGEVWNGVIFIKENTPRKRIELYLDVKAEVTLIPYTPDPERVECAPPWSPFDIDKAFEQHSENYNSPSPRSPFDIFIDKAFERDTWDRDKPKK